MRDEFNPTLFDSTAHLECEHLCDFCFEHLPPDQIEAHLRDAHGITEAGVVGRIDQEGNILTTTDAQGEMKINIRAALLWLSFDQPAWLWNGLISDTRQEEQATEGQADL